MAGTDLDPRRSTLALELGAIDVVGSDLSAEIAFVATPVAAIAGEAVRLLSDPERTGLVVTDVGGVKQQVVAALGSYDRFVGGHPMSGSEQVGPMGADPELFVGTTWVLTPSESTDPRSFQLVQSVVAELGADVVALAADRHDDLVALVSHVPHLAAACLMGLAADATESRAALLRLAAGGFRDMTRIAAGSPSIWPDICEENAAAIVPRLDALIERMKTVRAVVADHDRARLVDLLDHAQLARQNLPPRATRPSSLSELRVPVPDRPGVIAEVATIAGELGVNIEHLEMVHEPDRPRGVIVLTVAAAAADLVRHELASRGYGLAPSHPGGPGQPVRDEGASADEHRSGRLVVAIDGPAGAGKSTLAAALAARLGVARLDTGSMYRAVTLAVIEAGVDPKSGEQCAAVARLVDLRPGDPILMGGRDVTDAIRDDAVTELVSVVSAHALVRAELVRRQREWVAAHDGAVVEGRDIGSVVVPDAPLKVFLTADASERARRRLAEHGASEDPAALRRTEAAIARRDALDKTRADSPLVIPEGAVVVNSTGRSVEEVADEVMAKL